MQEIEIKFTVDQVNQLLNLVGDTVAWKQANPIIQFIKAVAEPQLGTGQEPTQAE